MIYIFRILITVIIIYFNIKNNNVVCAILIISIVIIGIIIIIVTIVVCYSYLVSIPVTNLVLNKPAWMHSSHSGAVASRATDGNPGPFWSADYCVHSSGHMYPTWAVDLQEMSVVHYVEGQRRRPSLRKGVIAGLRAAYTIFSDNKWQPNSHIISISLRLFLWCTSGLIYLYEKNNEFHFQYGKCAIFMWWVAIWVFLILFLGVWMILWVMRAISWWSAIWGDIPGYMWTAAHHCTIRVHAGWLDSDE